LVYVKNMKIGKKLFVGFAVPIALMIVIAILVVVMNLLTVDSIDTIQKQTELWNYATNAQNDFLQARIQAAALVYEYKEDTYNAAIELIDDAQTDVDGSNTYLEDKPKLAAFVDTAKETDTAIDNYESELGVLREDLLAAETAIANTNQAGAEIGEHVAALMEGQIASVETDMRGEITDAVIANRTTRLSDLNTLYTHINNARIAVREQLKLYDAAGANEALESLNAAAEELDKYIATLNTPANIETANTLREDLTEYRTAFTEFVKYKEEAEMAKAAYVSAGGTATNSLAALADQNAAVDENVYAAEDTAYLSLFIIAGIVIAATAITVFMAVTITKAITAPINYVTKILTAIGSNGRTHFSEDEWTEQKRYAAGTDEIADCAVNLGYVARALNGVSELLSQIADGDLTASHTAMSEDDTISKAIINMLKNLNLLFREIDGASDQVSNGANQIAEASQSLAQGSTEQAATVEELSASIADVAEKTKANAERAVDAAKLSETIKVNAQKGSEQMSEMTQAVSEINQASQDISKVIKVIDDIAFQTNILALNAAVEAARAGEAGKGFAVVADEVRNLASKSAAAAKETGSLIENSMKKAELGSAIAAETANSLSEIVDGINQSTDLITDIAKSSEEQNYAIMQINIGIGQVSEVVQKNSATAEESAASAEELNAQSSVLQGHISRFKLKAAS
jgi:methyl-accepting chemotaxis protein